jgi:toxin FitB
VILVDTNVWSETTKRQQNDLVRQWLLDNGPKLVLSSLVIAEIQYGIELAPTPAGRVYFENWLASLEARYSGHILNFDAAAGHAYAAIAARPEVKALQPQIFDMQIAAQAMAHGMPIATRNVKDFEWIGVPIINPWEA